MTQLQKLKIRLSNPDLYSDEFLTSVLEDAADIICDLRNSDIVEKKYLNTQIRIAVELCNKAGAEGQSSHAENGIVRTYERADLSKSLLASIIPMAKTVGTQVREIVE